MKIVSDFIVSSCEQLLQNKELIRYLEESKFDAILTDPVIPCGVILAEHLSLPSVYFLRGVPCGLEFEASQCPNPPSYVPRSFSDLTDQMTFFQRVKNLLFDTKNYFLCDFPFEPYSKLASDFLQREVTWQDLLRKGSVWLLRMEFVLDYPRPLMPNMIPIGGANCGHKELPQVEMHLRLLSLLPLHIFLCQRNFCASSPGYFQSRNLAEVGRLGGSPVEKQPLCF
uniref:UDP-glucuronosyltransferase 1-1 n=1 Tax=Serinus canaria TaxID=9135 RepID=A0A8C9N5W1_SERCA